MGFPTWMESTWDADSTRDLTFELFSQILTCTSFVFPLIDIINLKLHCWLLEIIY